ncbi:MAG: S8 family serine peptidase [Syntrophobacteraceae bacterium]
MTFEQLLDRDKILELIEQGTGKGIKVGILDSGVDFTHPALADSVHRSFEVGESQGNFVAREGLGTDVLGHGTMCAGVIHEIAPEAELYNIKTLDERGQNSPAKVICGIECAIAQGLHVLNLSLVSLNMSRNTIVDMLYWVEKAYYCGTILVAATDNKQKRGFPGDYSSVIAVDFQHFPDFRSFNYYLGKPVEMEAKGVYVKAPFPGNTYISTTCTSIACPHVTGLVARLLSMMPGLTSFQIKTLLMAARSNGRKA